MEGTRAATTIAPTSTASLIGVFDHIEELESLDPAARERLRFVMITHYNDGVGAFGPELADPGAGMAGRPPETRRATVPKGMRWTPTTGFFQVLVDMKNAANVVPGVFAATGHDYRADLLPFFNAVLGLEATPDQLAAHRRLARGARELAEPVDEDARRGRARASRRRCSNG